MSGCKGCRDKVDSNRYKIGDVRTTPKEINEKAEDLKERIEAFDKILDKDLPIDHSGPHSLETLIAMKEEADKAELVKFRASLSGLTYDERIFHVMSLVDIINGEQFSPFGHSPIYCICLLNKVLDFKEFDCVNEKFPTLKRTIREKFDEVHNSRVSLYH